MSDVFIKKATPFQECHLSPYRKLHSRVMILMVDINGSISVDELEKAWKKLIERHDGLRISFQKKGNEIIQIFHTKADFKIKINPDKAPTSLDDAIENFCAPIDIENLPLFRVTGFQKSDDHLLLLLEIHHAIVDGTALTILIKEWISILATKTLNTDVSTNFQYANFLEEYYLSNRFQKQKKYWEKKILQPPISKNLVKALTAYPENINADQSSSIHFIVDQKLNSKISTFIKKYKITKYAFFITIFSLTLMEYFNSTEVAFFTIVNGRNNKNHLNLMANLVNFILLRVHCRLDESVISFLPHIFREITYSLANMNYPYQLLKKCNSDLVSALSKNVFVYHNLIESYPELQLHGESKVNNTSFKFLDGKALSSPRFLRFQLTERENDILGVLSFNLAIYSKEGAQCFLDRFNEILDFILEKPYERLDTILRLDDMAIA